MRSFVKGGPAAVQDEVRPCRDVNLFDGCHGIPPARLLPTFRIWFNRWCRRRWMVQAAARGLPGMTSGVRRTGTPRMTGIAGSAVVVQTHRALRVRRPHFAPGLAANHPARLSSAAIFPGLPGKYRPACKMPGCVQACRSGISEPLLIVPRRKCIGGIGLTPGA